MRIVFRCDPAIENELIRPIAARAALPDWLRAMPRTAFSDVHAQDVRTVKQCPPFVDAMSHGFIVPLPCDVTVDDGVLSWDWGLFFFCRRFAISPLSMPKFGPKGN